MCRFLLKFPLTNCHYAKAKCQFVELFKDPEMLKRFQDISEFSEEDKKHILYTLDALIKSVKLKSIA